MEGRNSNRQEDGWQKKWEIADLTFEISKRGAREFVRAETSAGNG